MALATVDGLIEELQEKFGEDIRHIEGNLFKVKRSIIVLPEPFDAESPTLKAGNPRWFATKDKLLARGLHGTDRDSKEATELRESIRNHGMEHPVRLRYSDGCLIGVNGERRLRACEALEEEGQKCYDQDSGEYKPAKDVVGWVQARISTMSEEEAMELAVVGNDTSISIGYAATVNVVRAFKRHYEAQAEQNDMKGKRADKWVKAQIKKRMGNKSDTWIDDTYQLLNLDEETLMALHEEKIDRRVAIDLAAIQDVHERIDRLNSVIQVTEDFIRQKKKKLVEDMEKIQEKQELLEAKATEEELSGEDNSETEAKLEEVEERIAKKQEDLENLEKNPPAATRRQLTKAEQKDKKSGKKVTTTRVSTLSYSKRNKHWSKEAAEIIECEGCDDDGNQIFDPEDARLVMLLLKHEGENSRDAKDDKAPISLKRILKKHKKDKDAREE